MVAGRPQAVWIGSMRSYLYRQPLEAPNGSFWAHLPYCFSCVGRVGTVPLFLKYSQRLLLTITREYTERSGHRSHRVLGWG